MRAFIITLLLLVTHQNYSQQKSKVPKWFTQNMEESIGVWITDNATYKSEKEPMTSFAMEWTWGIGKQSINGTLYGFIGNQKVGPFWEFKQYWDIKENKGVIMQQGANGTIGIGTIVDEGNGKTKMSQVFTTLDGVSEVLGHESIMSPESLITISYDIDSDKKWKKRRAYTWIKENEKKSPKSESFSISLAVKDIKKSKVFYEALGFKIVDGHIDQRWLILKNEYSKIGLFQGMFPSNTLTFNPEDARSIFKKVKKAKIPIIMQSGMDQKKGKSSFMISDPDGNPILFDQH